MNIGKIIKEVRRATEKGCRFVSFMYQAKESGEVSVYNLLLGIDIEHAYRRDLCILPQLTLKTAVERRAREEIIRSIQDSLTFGVGHNPRYTQEDLYLHICKGLRYNQNSNQLHLTGYSISRQVIQPGVFKPRKSSEVVLAKQALKRRMKSGRFRAFVLDVENISGLKCNGKVLEIQI
jgi:hypothetical protein